MGARSNCQVRAFASIIDDDVKTAARRGSKRRRIAVVYNRDFEETAGDPENRARADIATVAEDVTGALAERGLDAFPVGVGRDVGLALEELDTLGADAVFNLCESIAGDNRFEPLLPTHLELAGVAYTGSDPVTLALCLHKNRAREILRAYEVSAPRGQCVHRLEALRTEALSLPSIVKPAREDASVGIEPASVVSDLRALRERVDYVLQRYRQPAVVEEYIPGREIYVSKLDDGAGGARVLPFFEIDFTGLPAEQPHIVSFAAKWDEASADYAGTPSGPAAPLPPELAARIEATARAAFEALGVRDYGRVDLRLGADGIPYVIDVNPNCDLSARGGGFARAARQAGLSYPELIQHVAHLALARADASTIPLAQRSRGAARADRPTRGKPVSPRRDRVRA